MLITSAMWPVVLLSLVSILSASAASLSNVTVVASGPTFFKGEPRIVPWGQLNGPRGMAFLPGTADLYVVNYKTDSLTIISNPGTVNQTVVNLQDAYAEVRHD